ncbi:MAG: flagellar motor protein MotB, partial [Methylococcaceae bacterium]|nr:flagellar motor protein MotB [Methylococcaceae bacterium]
MADCPKCPPVGAPMWLATFADMMSLLMCFFVLLLSMASTEVVKFKAVADSMKDAFGVQREVQVDQVPMGTSIIAQNFSPGQVTPSPLDEVKQSTAQDSDKISETPEDLEKAKQKLIEAKLEEIKEQAENIKKQLATEIEQGLVTVETNGSR